MDKVNRFRIFLGSSKDLMHWRKLVGHIVRLVNDEWTAKGGRVQLLVWENFRTEYEDKSKQEEYIDELVLPSDLCVILYDKAINPYTQRELDAKWGQNPNAVVCFHVSDKNHHWHEAADVRSALQAKGIQPIDIRSIEEFERTVRQLFNERIAQLKWNGVAPEPLTERTLYTTIPADVCDRWYELSDTIRNLDDVSRDNLDIRCRLYPLHKKEWLKQADHYVPLMKKQTSDDDLDEFKTALELQHESPDNRPALSLFTLGAIHKPDNNPEMADLLAGRDLFTVSVGKNMDNVRWRLFCWLLSQKNRIVTSEMLGFAFADGYTYYDGRPIASIDTLDSSGEVSMMMEDIKHDERAAAAINPNDAAQCRQLARLNNSIKLKRSKLAVRMMGIINDWIFDNVRIPNDALADVDPAELEESLDVEMAMADDAKRRWETIADQWNEKLIAIKQQANKLRDEIETLTGKQQRRKKALRLKELLEKGETICRTLAARNMKSPDELFATQMYMVGVYDTYLMEYAHPQEEDELYKRVFTDAETFGYHSPYVELARLNYGNACLRKGKYDEAISLLQQVIENLEPYDQTDRETGRILIHAYTTVIHVLIELDTRNPQIGSLLRRFGRYVDSWSATDESLMPELCMYWAALLHSEQRSYREAKEVAEKAFDVFQRVNDKKMLSVPDEQYGEVMCYFPNVIAAFYIDRLDQIGHEDKTNVLQRCESLINLSVEHSAALMAENRLEGMVRLADAYHQLGFLIAHSDNSQEWGAAMVVYQKAYKLREEVYAITNSVADEERVAETAVNIGGLCAQLLQILAQAAQSLRGMKVHLPDPFPYADKAIQIYAKHKIEGKQEKELAYYRAIQLKGSLKYYLYLINHSIKDREEGITLCWEAYNWDLAHPNNSYHDVFEDVATKILKQENII